MTDEIGLGSDFATTFVMVMPGQFPQEFVNIDVPPGMKRSDVFELGRRVSYKDGNWQLRIDYKDQVADIIDAINRLVAPHGLKFRSDGLPHDGYEIYYLGSSIDSYEMPHIIDRPIEIELD